MEGLHHGGCGATVQFGSVPIPIVPNGTELPSVVVTKCFGSPGLPVVVARLAAGWTADLGFGGRVQRRTSGEIHLTLAGIEAVGDEAAQDGELVGSEVAAGVDHPVE